MDQQQHMTITEAHPYHDGRGCKVFNPNCPKCREESKDTTYIAWSLHKSIIADLVQAAGNVIHSIKTGADSQEELMRLDDLYIKMQEYEGEIK